jgi:hypothetical protein
MTQAACRRPLSTKAWVRLQAVLWGIYCGRSDTVIGFSPSGFYVVLCQYHTTHVLYLYLTYVPLTLYNHSV